jgi:alcohol dehydrogenase (cytochrome c)
VFEGEYVPGEGYTLQRQAGAATLLGLGGVPITHATEVQANSPTESRTVWRIIQEQAADQPLMATAGGLVFQGTENDGQMKAYNAETGEVVWAFRTGSRFNATSITYLGPDDRQYLAIIASSAANNGAVAFDAAPDNANRYRRSGSTLYVWALPETVAGN